MSRIFITPDQAIKCLPDSKEIHTFRNPGGMLIGCDLGRDLVIKALNEVDKIEIAGPTCQSLGHGLAIDYQGWLFIETIPDEIKKLDTGI